MINKIAIFTLFLFSLQLVLLSEEPKVKVLIQVNDQNNALVEDASVDVNYNSRVSKKRFKGETNSKGIVEIEGNTTSFWIGGSISKDGYYKSSCPVHFKKKNKELNRWEPWGEVYKFELREMRNPVPMYAQKTKSLKFPLLKKKVGYDLKVGDWVKPYGLGKVQDFIFEFESNFKKGGSAHDPFFVSANLTFNNKLDGIQAVPRYQTSSSFIWPYEAPLNGYNEKLYKFRSYNMNGEHVRKTNIYSLRADSKEIGYIFRVRTQTNEKGEITSAYYGKLQGDFVIAGESFGFTYYLNQKNIRSLEFDKSKNLFNWGNKDWERTSVLQY